MSPSLVQPKLKFYSKDFPSFTRKKRNSDESLDLESFGSKSIKLDSSIVDADDDVLIVEETTNSMFYTAIESDTTIRNRSLNNDQVYSIFDMPSSKRQFKNRSTSLSDCPTISLNRKNSKSSLDSSITSINSVRRNRSLSERISFFDRIKREKVAERKRKSREKLHNKSIEQEKNTIARAKARENPEIAERDRILNTIARKNARENPEIAERDRVLDTMLRAEARKNPEIAERDRVLDTMLRAEARKNPEIAERDRVLDTMLRAEARKNPEYSERERSLRNHEAKFIHAYETQILSGKFFILHTNNKII